jgi:drug/metabolite transporter (DMT)-like permease
LIQILKRSSDLLLLLTAAIWGFAFVAQRQGMDSLDPFIYNGIRFALGALVVGSISFGRKSSVKQGSFPWLLGVVLFAAASLQQWGIVWTTAGNAGFITGLYVVIVPFISLYKGDKLPRRLLISVFISLLGLYLINDNQDIEISFGNGLVLVGAFVWAWHVHLIDRLTQRYDTYFLAFSQFAVCAVLSIVSGLIYNLIRQPDYLTNALTYQNIYAAGLPILYGGLLSVGIAYTLQVYAQKRTLPTRAAIILCLESVFALLGGWWLLQEKVSPQMLTGAGLLLLAMLVSLLKKTPAMSL